MGRFTISFTERAAGDAADLDASVASRIREAIETKLAVDPEHFGKPLRHSLTGLRVLRVGEWRILFTLAHGCVIVVTIRHRKKGYGDLSA